MNGWPPSTTSTGPGQGAWWCATCGAPAAYAYLGLDGRHGLGACLRQPFPCRGTRVLTDDPDAARDLRRDREADAATRRHADHVMSRRAHPLCRICERARVRTAPGRHAR